MGAFFFFCSLECFLPHLVVKKSALFCLIFPFSGGFFESETHIGLVGKCYALSIDTIINPHHS